ncbi:uncharacterized protein LOC126716943 isoform X3 [Quercus robur]|uniref:uncharacterized protein LOC126716943 isoform X3 n=1 Tax=Quercus robur TaxID=38942 RepID=UPI00216132E8|nr:uncharacterized protein LOC126716943 isoform X3 [Quercus robur]
MYWGFIFIFPTHILTPSTMGSFSLLLAAARRLEGKVALITGGSMVTICQKCGDRGFSMALIYCDRCSVYAQHRVNTKLCLIMTSRLYITREITKQIGECIWVSFSFFQHIFLLLRPWEVSRYSRLQQEGLKEKWH